MNARRQEGQHPDDEKVIWDERVDLRQTHGLDADAVEDLLVREAIEELPPDRADGRLVAVEEGLLEDQGQGEGDGDDGGDNETEYDLGVVSMLTLKQLVCCPVLRDGAERRGMIFRRDHV